MKLDNRPGGAALISAMALVLVVASLTVGVAWLGYQSISRTENQRDVGQARYLAQAMMDYARWILASDLRGELGGSAAMDHLSEPWSQPIPHTKLSSLMSSQMTEVDLRQFGQAAISGQIHDAQARFNLEMLWDSGALVPQRVERLRSGLSALGVGETAQSRLMEAAQLIYGQSQIDAQGRRRLPGAGTPSLWLHLSQEVLPSLGLEPADLARLDAVLVWLPDRTSLNVNTTSSEALMLVTGGEGRTLAEQIVGQRDRIPFRSLAELTSFIPAGQIIETSLLDTRSQYFEAKGYAQFGRAEQGFAVLLRRETGRVIVVDHMSQD